MTENSAPAESTSDTESDEFPMESGDCGLGNVNPDSPPESDDVAAATSEEEDEVAPTDQRSSQLLRLTNYVVLPALALLLAGAAAYFKYQDATSTEIDQIRAQSVQTAMTDTAALLSYTPDSVEAKLNAASDRLTGPFKDSYLALVRDTVIPGAKQKQISANATVPAGSSVSASRDHAKVMVFVNQTTTVGTDVPTDSASVVEVNLDNVDGRWLISGFEPK